MPGPYVVPVHGDAELPKEVDVVVIGGGIIGTSTALELVDQGLRVALCEKGGIGHEQSSRNWGWVRISRRDPREGVGRGQAPLRSTAAGRRRADPRRDRGDALADHTAGDLDAEGKGAFLL